MGHGPYGQELRRGNLPGCVISSVRSSSEFFKIWKKMCVFCRIMYLRQSFWHCELNTYLKVFILFILSMWRFDLLFFVMIECRVLLFMSFVSDIFILVLLLVVIIMLKVFIDFTSYF